MKKAILITGSSRGIGAATARLAWARKNAVCVSYRNNPPRLYLHRHPCPRRRTRSRGSHQGCHSHEARGEPIEVANAILRLLSDEASYVTGTFIDLAGGK